MRNYFFYLFCLCSLIMLADDIIVMRNGDLINAVVCEITQTEVKYKKASRPDGPVYTINKVDVLSINYEDGEKETFDISYNPAYPIEDSSKGIVTVSITDLNENEVQINQDRIAFYNQIIPQIPNSKEDGKKCGYMRYRFFVDGSSIMENEDVEIVLTGVSLFRGPKGNILKMIDTDGDNYFGPGIRCSVRNKTNTTIYIDLGNCFFTRLGTPMCYYTPSSITTTETSTSGGSVNLGAIAGAVGIGGVVGTLASGINVGGASTSGTSNTIYAQRVIAVPPMSTYDLSEKYLISERADNGGEYLAPGCKFNINGPWENSLNGKLVLNFPKESAEGSLKYNEEVRYSPETSPLSMSFVVSYSNKETFENGYSLPVKIYLGNVVGVHRNKAPFGENNKKEGLLWFTGKAHDKDKEPSARR